MKEAAKKAEEGLKNKGGMFEKPKHEFDEYDKRACGWLHVLQIDLSRITNQNTLAYVTPDKYPVAKGHRLIIPKRHVNDYFGLDKSESSAIQVNS